MSQGQERNTPGGTPAYPQQPPYSQQAPYAQGYPQAPYGQQVNPQAALVPGYAGPGTMAPQVPPGFYYDQLSGLVLPDGTALATVGRRIGAFFLQGVLSLVTLGIGYIIWACISFSQGQTPVQQLLGLQVWKPVEKTNATWGTMFLRALGYGFLGAIPFANLVSLFLFISGKEHRALHDSIASVIVLHDPNKVLRPVPQVPVG
jgi:uncharacterized RDD family membrane protein YckC